MSDEAKLNPQLKQLEASLGRLVIPSASLNRDELMYQSGWAAAMARIDGQSKISLADRNLVRLIWPVTAVIASTAAVLLAAVLLFRTAGGVNAPGAQAQDLANLENAVSDYKNPQPPQLNPLPETRRTNLVDMVWEIPPGYVLKSGLAFQQSPIPGEAVESAPTTVNQAGPQNSTVNHRQLMNELVPNRGRNPSTWRKLLFRSNAS